MTTIAAFAAIAIAASLAVGLVAPRLVSLGVPDAGRRGGDLRRVRRGRARRARPPARGRRLMIAATDIVTLAPGVDVRQELLRDAVRGHAWPLNASGAFVLARAGRPLGAVASELADAFSLPQSEARGDVRAIRLGAQPPRPRERRAHGVEARSARRLAATRGAARTGRCRCRRRSRADARSTPARPPLAISSCLQGGAAARRSRRLGRDDPRSPCGADRRSRARRAAARRARHGTRSRAARGGACSPPAGRPERTRRARAEDARPSCSDRSVATHARRCRRAAGRRGARSGPRSRRGAHDDRRPRRSPGARSPPMRWR